MSKQPSSAPKFFGVNFASMASRIPPKTSSVRLVRLGLGNGRDARHHASITTLARAIFGGGELYGDLLYDFYVEAFEGRYSSGVIG